MQQLIRYAIQFRYYANNITPLSEQENLVFSKVYLLFLKLTLDKLRPLNKSAWNPPLTHLLVTIDRLIKQYEREDCVPKAHRSDRLKMHEMRVDYQLSQYFHSHSYPKTSHPHLSAKLIISLQPIKNII